MDRTEESVIRGILEEIPCRENQINLLCDLFGKRNQYTCPALFIFGHSATGKSLVVSTLLKRLELPHAVVNCVECYTQRLMYEQLLNKVAGYQSGPSNNYGSFARCDNTNDFVRLLRSAIAEQCTQEETVYLVFDKAERLREMESNLLPAILRLSELSNCNVCVILISQLVWGKFRTGTGFAEPLILHFPDYSKAELLDIVSRDCPPGYTCEFYSSYANLLMSVFYIACRDLNEIRHLALLNFPKYIEPVIKGEVTTDNAHKLWRNIEPHLKKAMHTVYLREVSSSQWEKYQQEDSEQFGALTCLSTRSKVELPFYSKYLLIAAYLASYNPAKTDRRFFSKNHGKIKKSACPNPKKDMSSQLLGPKAFPLDRLMAIFYSIVDAKVSTTANIFSQISSLVTLSLLCHVGHDDQLDSPRYKCTVSLDFIQSVARTVSFDIIRYLFDFVQ
ncbi:origin recognition complex subunit 5-like isoform X3 [Anneissia japonica]|nr:origin recognition complex subunit 5-like isoform X3 [Anneissia japonica]XP_033103414.1 origin recognition complex subunit 5-like isoform X3 [Anneissia japonica]